MKIVSNFLINILLLSFISETDINAQQWNAIPDPPNAFVSAFIVDTSSSSLIVGGAFGYTGPMQNSYVAGWNGTNWFQIGNGNTFGGGLGVSSFEFFNNQLYAGGDFNGPYNLVTGWNGSSWFALNELIIGGTYPSGSNAEVKAVKGFNNKLYFTGAFKWKDYISSPDTVNSILTWDGIQCQKLTDTTGNKVGLSNFSTLGFTGRALHVFNNELYIAGVFDTICGVASPSRVAKTDGQSWMPVGTLLGTDSYCLHDYDNNLYAGGIGQYLFRYDGTSWITFATIGGQNPAVFAMTTYHGDLIIAGNFDSVNNISAKNIARWNGTTWSAFSSGLTNNFNTSSVFALTEFQNDLYAGGSFSLAGGITAQYIARWSEPTGINEVTVGNELKFYPNPSSTFLNIQTSEGNEVTSGLLYNAYGNVIRYISSNSIFIGDLDSGIYFVQIINKKGHVYSERLIKN